MLNDWFQQSSFSQKDKSFGIELEGWLTNARGRPKACNDAFLGEVRHSQFVHELSQYNFEINSSVYHAGKNLLSDMKTELENLWQRGQEAAQKIDAQTLMMGILPTLTQEDLNLKFMSSRNRYSALVRQFMELRKGVPLAIQIDGKDSLHVFHENIMLEAATTSLQIHTQVTQKNAVRAYNRAQMLSGPLVALSANSPFLFGKELWEETRIPLFEQAVSAAGFRSHRGAKIPRLVSFGGGYAKESLFELFMDNFISYPMLLPLLFDDPPEAMKHLKLLNGTVWRWNRPIVDVSAEGKPHLRIEHRVLSAGPTIEDMIANVAFYLGSMQALIELPKELEKQLNYATVERNFYRCAQWGLGAWVSWVDGGKEILVKDLLQQRLLPLARQGLESLGVERDQISHYMDGIIVPRLESGQNGAIWQCQASERLNGDLKAMTQLYVENQKTGRPVHEWK